MKMHSTISPEKKAKKPFIQSGKKDTFIQSTLSKKSNVSRVITQEKNADEFARKASETPEIANAFLNNFNTNNFNRHQNTGEGNSHGKPLNKSLSDAFENQFNHDFSEVIIHDNAHSTQLATEFNAAAFTVGNHIFLNQHVFGAKNKDSLYVLAHELFHAVSANPLSDNLNIQLKPLTELTDRTAEQQAALQRAVNIAQGETGKVNSATLNEDKTRVGWELLVEYFKTTLGEDTIVKDKSEYKPGKFLEEVIKYVRLGDAQKVKKVDNKYVVETVKNVDLLPSWCGIFAFWALHKGGVHPPKWEIGKPNFTAKDAFKKGEYLPRPGDIVIKNGYNHHALVVRTEPETVTDTKDLQNVKVITINGNTAGSNHQGGQIQLKTDPYSYWDFYINPFFDGVTLTDEKDYKVDDRLKKSVGGDAANTTEPIVKDADLSVNKYESDLQPVGSLEIPEKESKKKEKTEAPEETKIDPKEIMAKDEEFGQLHSSLEKNAETQKKHDTPENKANEAQKSAKSPENERSGKAKAIKVEKLGALPPPKKFDADELKANILKEVGDLLKKKEDEANETGEKPKINNSEIKKVKDKNNKEIQAKKTESVGDLEKTHKEQPDENSVEKRENLDVVAEDPGKNSKIQNTERAVAKPISDERITLEKEAGKIDSKMAENDVDEQQLEESDEPQFTGSLKEKRESQAEAANVKEDYKAIESEKLEKDKKNAKTTVNDKVDKVHEARESEFGKVDEVKNSTKSADELKRKEISDHIEKIYSDSEKSVTEKLNALETSVNTEFDTIMTTANDNFKKNVNNGLDDEFFSEFVSKHLDRSDYNRRVKKVFVRESEKYTTELSNALNPLTTKIANTLNAIVEEITAAKNAVIVYVNGLEPSLAAIGAESAKGVLEKFSALENSVNEKQNALTNNLAKKYADGVLSLETQFKEIMDSRKSWLERAFDAIVDAIKAIINLLADLKKALERAAEYGGRIIKSPKKFFNTLVKGATAGFNNFVSNIEKHLLNGALEWVTGEMSNTGIQLPKEFDFKGILSIVLQILGISVAKVKEIAKKVIGEKYVNILEKGVDIGIKVGEKIFKVFTIIKKEGITGLWEFVQEQFTDLKEKLLEEAKAFALREIIEAAVIRLISMLIPGAGFITAIRSLISFVQTLFAKARQIVNIITGIIDTFGEALAGNASKVSEMVEKVLAKFLSLAIAFLASVLGVGGIGKKIRNIIEKKIKEPIDKAITKMMEKLKGIMTKLGIFKLMDKIDEKIKQGKNWVEEKKQKGKDWVEDKKEKVKDTVKENWSKLKGFIKSVFSSYTDITGEKHTLKFEEKSGKFVLFRFSISSTLKGYLDDLEKNNESENKTDNKYLIYKKLINKAQIKNNDLEKILEKSFNQKNGEKVRAELAEISDLLKQLPSNITKNKSAIPEVKDIKWKTIPNKYSLVKNSSVISNLSSIDGESVNAPIISLNSKKYVGSEPSSGGSSKFWNDMNSTKLVFKNRVRGHILNHQLFGTGAEVQNLGPIPIKANNDMKNTFENDAKNAVHSGDIISYKVGYIYGTPNDAAGKIAKYIPGISLPLKVTYDINKLALKANIDVSKQEEVDKPENWKKDSTGLKVKGSFAINHDDFF